MPISTPSQIVTPWAESGLKNAIPQNADPINGLAGFDQGFPAINMVPKTAGGIPPFGQDFNGIFYDLTLAMQYLQAGGSFPYDGVWASAVGGYPVGALVSRTDNQGLWRSTVANNTTDPEAGGAGWQPEGAGATSVTMTSSNVTLTALEASRGIIIITGALTANLNLIFPAYVKQWAVRNATTGAFTITAKTAAGSGVAVTQGEVNAVAGDGIDIYKVSGTNVPDASTTVKGVVELATQTEALALTDPARAVTPDALAPLFGLLQVAHIVAINTSVAGVSGVNTRPLNTVQRNTIVGASLAANQITLPAGTYQIDGYGICLANKIRTYLYNVTDSANAVLGASISNNNANDAELAAINGVFTIAATKVFEVRHELGSASTAIALGSPANLTGNEIYAVIKIRRLG